MFLLRHKTINNQANKYSKNRIRWFVCCVKGSETKVDLCVGGWVCKRVRHSPDGRASLLCWREVMAVNFYR